MADRIQTRTTRRYPSLLQIWQRLLRSATLNRSRRKLIHLDDHLLRDVGLTRDEAEAEAARPVWDVPQHWKR